MKKKFIILLSAFLLTSVSSIASVNISFNVCITDPTTTVPSHPKSPINPPQATLDGHVLTFTTSHADFVLTLLDEDGEEAYTVFVPAATTTVVLPSTLTGLFELQLYPGGSYYFSGDIVL